MCRESPPSIARKKPRTSPKLHAESKPTAAVLARPLLLLLLLNLSRPAAAQSMLSTAANGAMQLAQAPRDLLGALPRTPLGAHCLGSVVCTEMGTWGVHARLTGSTLIRSDSSLPGGLLTPAASVTFGGWGEVGAHFPILFGPFGVEPLPLPPVLFAKGAFTPPFRIGQHGAVFATLTMPHGPFAAPDERGQPMARRYEIGAALAGRLLWMFHYGLSVSGQFSPGGPASRLLAGLALIARFDGFNVFAQPTYTAAFCEGGSAASDCQSSASLLFGVQIPLVAGHASAAGGLSRGIRGLEGTVLSTTLGASYDEATRAKYGDGIEMAEKLWVRLFTVVIDPYLDDRCLLWDDDHKPMVEVGHKSKDGMYCEQPGLRTRIDTHFDRDKASTRICYDAGLRNCVLHRDSAKDFWKVVPVEQQARRPYLKDDCHVYEAGVMLPLQQVGSKSADGQACEWQGHHFPIGTKFWVVPGDDVLCMDATLKDCSIELPPKPMTTGQYIGSRFEQGLVRGVTNLVEKIDRVPRVAEDLASGRLRVQTVAGEAYDTIKEDLGNMSLEGVAQAGIGVVESGKEWLAEPLHRQLGDLVEAAGKLPAKALENEMTGGLGNVAGGVTGAARTGAKVEKAVVKTEKAVVKTEKAAANAEKGAANAKHASDGAAAMAVPNVTDRLPDDRLSAPPRKRGHAPRGDDGHPVELHHTTQAPTGPVQETTRTDHRIGPNFQQNHPNTGHAPSQIDRSEWQRQKKTYWRQEWDKGRFDGRKKTE